jgi:hypothetical protein
MFDHVKHVVGWTTMACHVYNPTYYKVMTIAVCDMEDQQVMWTKFNDTMLKNGFPKPNFKGFMVNRAQAN